MKIWLALVTEISPAQRGVALSPFMARNAVFSSWNQFDRAGMRASFTLLPKVGIGKSLSIEFALCSMLSG